MRLRTLRPLQVPAGHWELSGSLYHFPRQKVEALKQYLGECLEGVPQDQQAATLSNILAYDWLQSVLNPLSLLSHDDGEKSMPASEIPDDVKKQLVHDFKQKHYDGWSDKALPALDGKTPREAVATEVGKRTVVSLLKDFENIEAGDEYPFDFGFLWQDLGLQRS